jgi:mRNA interferase MazF
MKHKIVLTYFPFDDLTGKKLRPALCLTELMLPHNQLIVAFITSKQQYQKGIYDVAIGVEDEQFYLTGLETGSVIRVNKLATISDNLVSRILGELPLQLQQDVANKIGLLFG